jgi:uncharacterized SAM-dependent methyltransferase
MKSSKPVLFVGSSFEARDFAGALQLNLKEDARVIPWTQVNFELSSFTLETLESELERADFAAFIFAPDDHLRIRGDELSATRDNVLLELGMFIGRLGRQRSFIVLATGTEKKLRIPTDLLGLTVATYDHSSYDSKEGPATETMGTASTKIGAAIRKHGLKPRPPTALKRRVERVLSRGSTDSILSVADGAIYVADSRHKYPLQLKNYLLAGEVVPTKYLYCTPYGSSHWLEICKRRSYTFYRNSLSLLRAKAPEIMAKIVDTLETPEIDFISIGSGDGIKDNILLRQLAPKLRDAEFAYYYPVDISPDLIVHAIPTALGRGVVRSGFRVKAIIADFAQLSALQLIYEERPARNVFSVLGNTVGNADEVDLMRSIADAMFDGDMLLLEIDTSEPKEDDPMLREKANMEHDFTPLKSLNIDFDPTRMEYHLLSEQSVVPETNSVLASYSKAVIDNQTVSNIKLSIVHHYDLEQFAQAIEDRMSVKTVARYEEGGVGIILAQR